MAEEPSAPREKLLTVNAANSTPPDVELINCQRATELLGDYADGTLGDAAVAGLELHLTLCPACETKADEYLEVIRLARSLKPPVPSPRTAGRILDRLRKNAVPPAPPQTDDTQTNIPPLS